MNNYKKKTSLIIIVIFTNFYFIIKDLQLFHNLLSPYTKNITIIVFIIFTLVTLPKLKIIINHLKKYSTPLLLTYLFFLLFVMFRGPNMTCFENILTYIQYFMSHYIAFITIGIFLTFNLKDLFQKFIDLFSYYILFLAFITIILSFFLTFNLIDLNNWVFNYEEFFSQKPATANTTYYFPFYLSIIRQDQVIHMGDLSFYRFFSYSTEPGIAVLFAFIPLVFKLKNIVLVLISVLYVMLIGSFSGFLGLIFFTYFIIFKSYPRMQIFFLLCFLISLVFFLIIFLSDNPYKFIPKIEYIHRHVYVLRDIILNYFNSSNITMIGSGFTSLPGILPLQILEKYGLLGFLLFFIFYISILMTTVYYIIKNEN
jgi:hypothetical protein